MGRKAIRAAKVLRQQEILNTVKQETRNLTTEEQAEFDSLQREIDDLTREIEERKRSRAVSLRLPRTPASW